jgi:hypothetical protein
MEEVDLMELTKQIVRLEKEIYGEFTDSGRLNRHKGTLLADCLSYCLYLVLDLIEGGKKEEKTKELVDQLMKSEAYCKNQGDRLHADFFYTLSQLISIKYNLAMLRGEVIERDEFEKRWRRTREELRL